MTRSTDDEIAACAECGCEMVNSYVWRRMSAEGRAGLIALGVRRLQGHGLCSMCYLRRVRGPRSTLTREIVLAEWDMFAKPGLSRRKNAQRVAAALGVHPKTIERAIERAVADGVSV